MDEYVSREKMMALFNKYHSRLASSVVEYWTELEKLPTEDVAPARHGRWISYRDLHSSCCSECNAWWIPWGEGYKETYRYCPNCGAKMMSL